MAGRTDIFVDIATYKKFADVLNDIIVKLEKLDQTFQNLGTSMKDITFKFDGLKEFQTFLQTVSSTRSLRNPDKFKTYLHATKDIVEITKRLSKAPSAKGKTKLIADLVTAISEIVTKGISSKNVSYTTDLLEMFVDDVRRIIFKVSDYPKAARKAVKDFTETFRVLAKFVENASRLQTPVIGPGGPPQNMLGYISQVIKQLSDLTAGISDNAVDKLKKLGDAIANFGNILGRGNSNIFSSALRNTGNAVKFLLVLPAMLAMLITVFRLVSMLTMIIPGELVTIKLVNSLYELSQAFVNFGKALGGKDVTLWGSFVRSVGNITKFLLVLPPMLGLVLVVFKLIGAVTSLIPGGDALQQLSNSLRSIGLAFANFAKVLSGHWFAKVLGILFLMPIIFGWLTLLFKGIATILRLLPAGNALENLSRSLRNIGLALMNFVHALSGTGTSAANPQRGLGAAISGWIKLGLLLPTLFLVLAAAFRLIGLVLHVLPGGRALEQFADTMLKLGAGIQALSSISSNVAAIVKVNQAAKILKAVGKALEGLTKSALRQGILQEVIQFANSFESLGIGINKIADANKKINILGVIQMGIKLNILGVLIRAAASISKFGGNANAIALGEIVGALATAMDKMSLALKRSEKTNSLGIVNLMKFLLFMKALIGTVKGIAKGLGKANIENIGKLLNALGRLIVAIFNVLDKQQVAQSKVKNVLGVKDRLNLIKDLLKELRKFKGSQMPDLSATLRELPNLLKSLSTLTLDEKAGEKIRTNVRHLGEAFKEVSKIKASAAQFKAIEQLSRALKTLGNLKNTGSLSKVLGSFRDLVAVLATTKLDINRFRDLSKVADEIVKALNKLKNVKVDDQQIQALKELVEAIKAVQGTPSGRTRLPSPEFDMRELTSTGRMAGGDMADAVERGFLSANMKMAITRFFINTFRSLVRTIANIFDPVKIFNAVRDGLRKLIDFGQRALNVFSQLRQKIQQIGQQIRQVGDNIVQAGQNLINNFGVGKLMQSNAFQATVEYDKLLRQVQVYGNLTQEQLDRIEKAATKIGIDFPLSAAEALAAAQDLIKAGLSDVQVEQVLPAVANLQVLSDGMSMEETSKGIIQIISTFDELRKGVPATYAEAATAADIFAAAADISTASVAELIAAFENVGPIASQFGMTFEEAAAVLAVFHDNGLRGAESGTALRNMLSRFTNPQAQQELRRLGVAWTDTNGEIRNFFDIFEEIESKFNDPQIVSFIPRNVTAETQRDIKTITSQLRTLDRQLLIAQNGLDRTSLDPEANERRISELTAARENAMRMLSELTGSQENTQRIVAEIRRTEAQNVETLRRIFGPYGQIAASIWIEQAGGMDAYLERMRSLPPAAQRAQQFMDNFAGAAEQLSGSIETLTTVALAPMLNEFFRPIVDVLGDIVNAFLDADESVAAFMGTAAVLGSTLATASGALLIFSGSLVKVGGIALSTASYLLSMRTIGFGIIGTVTSLAAGFASLLVVAVPLAATIGVLALVWRGLSTIWNNDLGNVRRIFQILSTNVKNAANALAGLTGEFVGLIRTIFIGDKATEGRDFLTVVAESISGGMINISRAAVAFTLYVGTLRKAFWTLGQVLSGNVFDHTSVFVSNPFLAALLERGGFSKDTIGVATFAATMRYHIDDIRKTFTILGSTLNYFFSSIKDGTPIRTAFEELSHSFRYGIGFMASEILDALSIFIEWDIEDLQFALFSGDLGGAFNILIKRMFGGLRESLLENRDVVNAFLTEFFRTFFIPGKIIGRLAEFIGLNSVADLVNTYVNTLTSLFSGVVDVILNLIEGQSFDEAIRNAFGKGIYPLMDFVGQAVTTIQIVISMIDALIGAFFQTNRKGEIQKGDTLLGFINRIFRGAADALRTLNNEILGPLSKQLAGINFTPVTNFVGELLGGLASFVSQLVSADFSGAARTLSGVIESIMSLIGSLFTQENVEEGLGFIQGLISAILTVLQGALQIVLGGIGTILGIDSETIIQNISNAFNPLISAIEQGDPIAIFGGVANAITGLLLTAITTVIGGVQTITGIDMSTILTNLENTMTDNLAALGTEGPGAPFFIVANTIVSLFAAALSLAFAGIGEATGIDMTPVQTFIDTQLMTIVEELEATLVGKENIFSSITTILSKLGIAITVIFNALNPSKKDGDPILTLDQFVSLLNTLSGIALDAIMAPLRLIRITLDRMAELDPQHLLAVGGALVTTMTGLSVLSFLRGSGGVSGGLTSMLTAIKAVSLDKLTSVRNFITTAANSTLAKGAALLVIIDFLTNLVNNLTDLESFDIGSILEAVLNAFIDFGEDIVIALGLEDELIPVVDQARTTLSQLATVFSYWSMQIGAFWKKNVVDVIDRFIHGTLPLAWNEIQRLARQVELKFTPGGEDDEVFAAQMFAVEDAFAQGLAGNQDLTHLFNNIFGPDGDPALNVDPLVRERFLLLARRSLDQVAAIFASEIIRQSSQGTPEDVEAAFRNWLPLLVATDGLDDAFSALLSSGDDQAISNFIYTFRDFVAGKTNEELATIGITQETVNQILENIFYAFAANPTGEARDEAINLLDFFILNTNISDAKANEIKQRINEWWENLYREISNTPVDVPVDPQPVIVEPEEPSEQPGQGYFGMDPERIAQMQSQEDPVPVPVPIDPEPVVADPETVATDVTDAVSQVLQEISPEDPIGISARVVPNFDFSGLGNEEDVINLAENVGILATEFTELDTAVANMVGPFTTNVSTLTTVYTPFKDLMTTSLERLTTLWGDLLTAQQQFQTTFMTNTPIMIGTGLLFEIGFGSAMTRTKNKVDDLKLAVDALRDSIMLLGNFAPNLMNGLFGTRPEGRRLGGPVYGNRIYEVNEDGIPEILTMNGRTYLLPGSSGYVTPVSSLPRVGSAQYGSDISRSAARGPIGGGFGGGVNFVEGDITISVNVDGGNPQAVADAIINNVEPVFIRRDENVRRLLRHVGATGV